MMSSFTLTVFSPGARSPAERVVAEPTWYTNALGTSTLRSPADTARRHQSTSSQYPRPNTGSKNPTAAIAARGIIMQKPTPTGRSRISVPNSSPSSADTASTIPASLNTSSANSLGNEKIDEALDHAVAVPTSVVDSIAATMASTKFAGTITSEFRITT